ncbi:cellulase [Marinilabiliaceae bacterium JC017]|nr:cellulase [Marinilabiliaceae bacterium JC017]
MNSVSTQNIRFRNRLLKGVLVCVAAVAISTGAWAQKLNQVAFRPESVKRVFFDGNLQGEKFQIIDAASSVVFDGELTKSKYWPCSGTKVCYAEFSDLSNVGQYNLILANNTRSLTFDIKGDVYNEVGKAMMKSFYYARASMEIKPVFAGKYARPAGHPDNQVYIHESAASGQRPAGSVISSPGGWYDAGDYNKYIVNSGITTYTLLHLYDLFGDNLASFKMNIPESGNGLSDLLNETIYNLRWMLTMQDPNDGGVYHKLTTKNFCGMKMPYADNLDRYVVMKSTAATLDFTAVAAKSYRILKAYENELPGLADSCLKAARLAWDWSMANPKVLYRQPDDITTGAYKGDQIEDEWFWASVEMYLATGDSKYVSDININKTNFMLPQWGRVNTLGLYSVCTSETTNSLKELDVKTSKKKLIKLADHYLETYKHSGYRISIDKFPWGSNSELANQGILLMHAYLLTNNQDYLEAADACVGYILGANPLDRCFVTGFGNNSPMSIHDRRSIADGITEPIPGLLAGGPSKEARHDCGEDNYQSEFPALSYVDMECSFATNEIAINWNSAATFLILGLDAIYSSEK